MPPGSPFGTPSTIYRMWQFQDPLAYNIVDGSGFRVEIRVSQFDDAEVVDDVVFLDASSVETVELQVKQKGAVWHDEPFTGIEGDPEEGDR